MEQDIKFNFVFHGSKEEVAIEAILFNDRFLLIEEEGQLFSFEILVNDRQVLSTGQIPSKVNRVEIRLKKNHEIYGLIETISTSLEITHLRIHICNEIVQLWEMLEKEWEKRGRLDNSIMQNEKSKGGRPSYPEDDWEYNEIKKGRNGRDVFFEWKKKLSDERKKGTGNLLGAFQKSISRRKKKEQKGKD